MTTLEHYAEINPSPRSLDRTSLENVAFVPMAAVTEDGRLDTHETRPLKEVAKGYTYFERGDVLLAKITPCMENGKAALTSNLVADRGFGSTEFHVLRPRPGVDGRFLFYLVWNQRFRVEAAKHMTGSAGQKRVPSSFLKQATVPLVEPNDQRRIADILERADIIRRKRNESIALAEELRRSAFLDLFGDPMSNSKSWPVCSLGELAEVGGGLQVTSARMSNSISLPYLRVANVYRDRLYLGEVKEIRVSPAERERALLRKGDVLVVEGHGNAEELGRSAVWNGEIPDCTHQNHLIRVRSDLRMIRPTYLSAFLNSAAGRAQMLKLGKTTSGLNTISTNNVRSLSLQVPPLELQCQFETIVHRVRVLSDRIQRHRYDEDLFQSLLHYAYS